MPKTSILTLRIDAQAKQRIVAAAHRKGRSLTCFMLEAVLNNVKKSESAANRKAIMSLAHFRKLCRTAQAGGEGGYCSVGRELMAEIESWRPPGALTLEKSLLSDDGHDDVFKWFEWHLPRYAKLIPERRTAKFVEGVREAFREASPLTS